MHRLRFSLIRILNFFRRSRIENDLRDQLAAHRDMIEADLLARGMKPSEAKLTAKRSLGNESLVCELSREQMVYRHIEECFKDIRIGARMLAKTPLFTLFAAMVLAVAIGANITVFSIFSAIFGNSVEVPNPHRFVRLYNASDGPGGVLGAVRIEDYIQYRDQNQAFADIAAYNGRLWRVPVRVEGPTALPLDMIRAIWVTGNLFETVGVRAALGRVIFPEDAQRSAANVAVLSDEGWKRFFARDRAVIGQKIFMGPVRYTVVGVMPPSFNTVFQGTPEGWNLRVDGLTGPLVFVPWMHPYGGTGDATIVGRLKEGIPLRRAQADISRIASRLTVEEKRHVSASVVPGNKLAPQFWTALAALTSLFIAGVAVVLMIACDNIAILLQARIAARRREVGIRLALGATRGQLIRQLVAENVMLSVVGGVGAMFVALVTARIVERLPLPLPLPDAFQMTFDWRVLVFASAISLVTTLLFGMRPALQCVSKDVVVSMNPGSSPGNTSQASVRSTLLITQVTVCTALLITAAVLVRSQRMPELSDQTSVPDHVLLAKVHLGGYNREAEVEFYENLLDRLGTTPGIVSAAVVESEPVARGPGMVAGTIGRMSVRNELENREHRVHTNGVTRGYFSTLNVRLLNGRDFTTSDRAGSRAVGIVNETMASQLWPGERPVGRWLRLANGSSVEIVGLVPDVPDPLDPERRLPFLYLPLAQKRFSPPTILVKTTGQAMRMTSVFQAKIAERDPTVLAYDMRSLEQGFNVMLLPNRLGTYIAGVPGALAFMLGIIGTYGAMALIVTQRRREMGIRIALGAHPSRAVRMMLGQGMKWTGIGLALGTIGALLLVWGLRGYFYGLSGFDSVAFVLTLALLAATAATACYIPARRASRVDPMIVLRED